MKEETKRFEIRNVKQKTHQNFKQFCLDHGVSQAEGIDVLLDMACKYLKGGKSAK